VSDTPVRRLDTLGLVSIGIIIAALALLVGHWMGSDRAPGVDSVDVGFLWDMSDHHDQANEMAAMVLTKDVRPDVTIVAAEILMSQRYEIGRMSTWLDDWGIGRGDPDRQAMTWMPSMSPTPVAEMPGMQSKERMDELRQADGPEAERLFLEMMIDHHRGGVHMAKDAARRAGDARVRDQAERMAEVQRREISEMRFIADKLGLRLET
jgi:uncharacterized protein (DUF305 family)